jgi:hypothetical protein
VPEYTVCRISRLKLPLAIGETLSLALTSRFANTDAKFSFSDPSTSLGPAHLPEISKRLAISVSNAPGTAEMPFPCPLYFACVSSILPAINRQNENCGFVSMGEYRRNCCPIMEISLAASMHVSAEDEEGSFTGEDFQWCGG